MLKPLLPVSFAVPQYAPRGTKWACPVVYEAQDIHCDNITLMYK
jgi:hypothetical protein